MNLGNARGVVNIVDVGDFEPVVNVTPATVTAVAEATVEVRATETVDA